MFYMFGSQVLNRSTEAGAGKSGLTGGGGGGSGPPLIPSLPPSLPAMTVIPQQLITAGTRKDCIRLRGLPYEAQVEHILEFLGEHAKNIIYQGVHMVFNAQVSLSLAPALHLIFPLRVSRAARLSSRWTPRAAPLVRPTPSTTATWSSGRSSVTLRSSSAAERTCQSSSRGAVVVSPGSLEVSPEVSLAVAWCHLVCCL